MHYLEPETLQGAACATEDDTAVRRSLMAGMEAMEATRKAVENSEVAGKAGGAISQAAEVVHQGTRAAANALGVSLPPEGMPDVKDGKDHVDDAVEAISDAVPKALEEAAKSFTEAVVEGIGEEYVEAAFEVVPILGSVKPAYNLIVGGATFATGLGGIAYAGFKVVFGANGKAKSAAVWSGSVSAEGTLLMLKGFVGLMSQIPGTQLVTTPISVCLGLAVKSVRGQREDSERCSHKKAVLR